MKQKLSDVIETLQNLSDKDKQKCLEILLVEMQKQTIGYYKDNDKYICVIDENKYTIKTLEVTNSFGSFTTTREKQHVIKFPDGKTLYDMTKDPLGFHEWTKKNLN